MNFYRFFTTTVQTSLSEKIINFYFKIEKSSEFVRLIYFNNVNVDYRLVNRQMIIIIKNQLKNWFKL